MSNFTPIARTAGGKLARRSAYAVQAALIARGFALDPGHEGRKVILADFAEDFDVALARLRARGVDAVEVSVDYLEALKALASLNA